MQRINLVTKRKDYVVIVGKTVIQQQEHFSVGKTVVHQRMLHAKVARNLVVALALLHANTSRKSIVLRVNVLTVRTLQMLLN